MSVTLSLSPEVYFRLEKLAVGFDTPSNVIERLLDEHDANAAGSESSQPLPARSSSPKMPSERLFENSEIQRRIVAVAKTLPTHELDRLCDLKVSKELFSLSFPLFVRVPTPTNQARRREAIKDDKGYNRWTWKFSFERDGYAYAVCTQWFLKQDAYVQSWLEEHE